MLLERSCPMQLKRRPHHNSKGPPSHLSQLERNSESRTTSLEEPCAATRKDSLAAKLGAPPPPKLERIPLPKPERSPLAHCT